MCQCEYRMTNVPVRVPDAISESGAQMWRPGTEIFRTCLRYRNWIIGMPTAILSITFWHNQAQLSLT